MKAFLLFVLFPIAKLTATTHNLNWNRNVRNQGTTNIQLGDTVVWTWTESRTHTVTSTTFDSGAKSSSGSTYSYTFNTAGDYSYHCSIHTMMQGVISVSAPSPTSSPTRTPTRDPTLSPTLVPTTAPTPAPTEAALANVPTHSPSTSTPTLSPSTSSPSAPPSSVPSLSPTTSSPTSSPTLSPTIDLASKLENALKPLPEFSSPHSEWNLTLEVRQHRHSNTQVSFTTRSYCIDDVCSYPGPTIRIKPGDKFNMKLVNNLGPNSASNTMVHNSMHSPNTTNVHTHGLHISPDVDSVFVTVEPGNETLYPYELPENHAPGLHWYHAHFHGSSAFQLMGGLVGALIVDPVPDDNIPSSITSGDRHTIVITKLMLEQEVIEGEVSQGCFEGWACNADEQMPLCTGSEDSSPFNPFRIYSLQELAEATGSIMDMDLQIEDESDKNLNLVNGLYKPLQNMTTNSSSIFRVLHAAGGGPLHLSVLPDETNGNMLPCSMTVLAWDGVYLDERLDYDRVSIVAASRVDIEVTCVVSGLHEIIADGKTLLYLYTTDDPDYPSHSPVTNEELAAIRRPWYLKDLLEVDENDIDSLYEVSINQDHRPSSACHYWLGVGSNCSNQSSSDEDTCVYSVFEGERGYNPQHYSADGKLVTFEGALNEWRLYGQGSAFHPLHVHVNHMQIVSWSSHEDDSPSSYYRVGQWRDTIPPIADKVVFRFRAANMTGEHVLHCHFQRHEDLGMMDTYLVLNETAYEEWEDANSPDEGDDSWCFHVDSIINYKGQEYSYQDLMAGKEEECVVPHSPNSFGVQIKTSCNSTLRVTDTHLIATSKGFRVAYSLKIGDVLFSDLKGESGTCTVLSVEKETSLQQYFGLNCVHSEVLVSGIRASTFGDFHTLPAWFMNYVGGILGTPAASYIGDFVADWYFKQ